MIVLLAVLAVVAVGFAARGWAGWAELGPFGDFFGGIANIGALLGVVFALILQTQELREQRLATQASTEAVERSAEAHERTLRALRDQAEAMKKQATTMDAQLVAIEKQGALADAQLRIALELPLREIERELSAELTTALARLQADADAMLRHSTQHHSLCANALIAVSRDTQTEAQQAEVEMKAILGHWSHWHARQDPAFPIQALDSDYLVGELEDGLTSSGDEAHRRQLRKVEEENVANSWRIRGDEWRHRAETFRGERQNIWAAFAHDRARYAETRAAREVPDYCLEEEWRTRIQEFARDLIDQGQNQLGR